MSKNNQLFDFENIIEKAWKVPCTRGIIVILLAHHHHQ